jgi:hypothetical protein
MKPEVSIERVRAHAFEIPTDRREGDGTVGRNSTTPVLVEAAAGDNVATGYTYLDASMRCAVSGAS